MRKNQARSSHHKSVPFLRTLHYQNTLDCLGLAIHERCVHGRGAHLALIVDEEHAGDSARARGRRIEDVGVLEFERGDARRPVACTRQFDVGHDLLLEAPDELDFGGGAKRRRESSGWRQ